MGPKMDDKKKESITECSVHAPKVQIHKFVVDDFAAAQLLRQLCVVRKTCRELVQSQYRALADIWSLLS
jgi:hypothetical protein